jgi:microcystin-dependent protein
VTSPYVGEIRMGGWNFAPTGWAMCNGQLLPISENETLFQLIGTTYGGDGVNNFQLPDLRGRLPLHQGAGLTIGQAAGTETVTLTTAQIPAHPHPFFCTTNPGAQRDPTGNALATIVGGSAYAQDTPTTALAPASLQNTGGNRQHNNMQPYQCVTFIISLFGIFPSPS